MMYYVAGSSSKEKAMDANGSCYIITYLWSTLPAAHSAQIPSMARPRNFFIQPRNTRARRARHPASLTRLVTHIPVHTPYTYPTSLYITFVVAAHTSSFIAAEFFTPRKHENNVVLTHFLFQIPRTFKLSVKIGLQSEGSLKGQIRPFFDYQS